MCSRLNGNQFGVICSHLYERYWMLRRKRKLALKIQTKLINADIKAYAVRTFVQKCSLEIYNTPKISLVISFLALGLALKTRI
jgi:hypothetical protein